MMKTRNQLGIAVRLALGASLMPLSLQVGALEYQVNDDLKINFDTTMTYGRQWRTEDRDHNLLTNGDMASIFGMRPGTSFDPLGQEFKDLVQRTNADDATRNFDKGDVISSRFSIVSDFDISYKNVGFFVRPQIFYDEVPNEESSWDCQYACDPSLYAAGQQGGRGILNSWESGEINQPKHFGDDYQDTLGYEARFLDVYAYGNFDINGHTLDVRLGRQVISWGEALMLQGGIAFAQNRVDASAATAPGVELKEIFLPTGALYGSISASENVTIEAYWQYEWIPSTLFPTGSFFSMQDFIDGDIFYTHNAGSLGSGYMTRQDDNEPGNNKQFGFAARYLLGEGTEAAFYMVNYSDKYPMFWAFNDTGDYDGLNGGTTATDAPYSISYFDNIRMYGLTLNTVVGGVQTGIEYAYRANAPIVPACTAEKMKAGTCRDPFWEAGKPAGSVGFYPGVGTENALVSWPIRAEIHTLNIGGTYIFQPNPLWDTATLVGELGGWYVGSGIENDDLQFAHLGAFTKFGEGMSAQFMPEYKNVMEGVDLTIPFFVNYGIDGSMSTFNYNEKNLWWSVGAEALYLEHWRFATYYNNYSGPNNLQVDRDNVSVNVKYIF
jgi:hypothetical protein